MQVVPLRPFLQAIPLTMVLAQAALRGCAFVIHSVSRHSRTTRTLGVRSLLIASLVACKGGHAEDRSRPTANTGPSAGSKQVDTGSAAFCRGTGADSDPIPYSVVDLGRDTHLGVPYVLGPPGRAIVRTPQEWERVWRQLASSQPLPVVNLRDSVVLIVASAEFTTGPQSLEFESVRRCREDGNIVALLRMHFHEHLQDYGARSLRAVALSRALAERAAIRFIDLADVIDR